MVMLETSFPHTKWLRHGDPLFSILYNLMAILAIWIGGEKENITSLWVGVVLHMRVYLSYNMLTTNYYLWIMILNMRNISNFLLLNNGSASAWMFWTYARVQTPMAALRFSLLLNVVHPVHSDSTLLEQLVSPIPCACMRDSPHPSISPASLNCHGEIEGREGRGWRREERVRHAMQGRSRSPATDCWPPATAR
jgi:hypothetical protein